MEGLLGGDQAESRARTSSNVSLLWRGIRWRSRAALSTSTANRGEPTYLCAPMAPLSSKHASDCIPTHLLLSFRYEPYTLEPARCDTGASAIPGTSIRGDCAQYLAHLDRNGRPCTWLNIHIP
eukprot:scaffold102757_cov36-Tisochrysis_lutea.AAC.3